MTATQIQPIRVADNATQEILDSLTDEQLKLYVKEAVKDCGEAANTQKDSEWHMTCFAACVILSKELSKRGIDMRVLH